MKQSDQSKYREQFNQVVDRGIRETSRETGITDVDTVDRYVRQYASILFRRISLMLAAEQRRVIIQKRLKRCVASVKKAQEEAAADAAQMEFDFFEMEQFRGLTRRISYPEGKEMKYVEYSRSLERQRELSIAHLDRGIAADVARRQAEVAANDFLARLVKRYGDLPAEELTRLWLGDERERGAAGGNA